MALSLTNIGYESFDNSLQHGFDPPIEADWSDLYKVPAFLDLIHSEASEALEAFRMDDMAHFGEELADVVIRTCQLAYGLGINLDDAVAVKMLENRGREHKHGGKRI